MRPEGWEARLCAEIEAARNRRWEWGTHDCATFAYRCMQAMIGDETPFDRWMQPRWTNRAEAQGRLSHGGGYFTILDSIAERRSWKTAQRGDLAALVMADGPVMGVVEGGGVWVAQTPRGVLKCRLQSALGVWSLP